MFANNEWMMLIFFITTLQVQIATSPSSDHEDGHRSVSLSRKLSTALALPSRLWLHPTHSLVVMKVQLVTLIQSNGRMLVLDVVSYMP